MQMQTVQTKQSPLYTTSCTPMLEGTAWHMRREDFVAICADVAAGDALRYFEVQTIYRINDLRRDYGIPENELPANDDLWIDASVRQIEKGTLHAQGKSTYALRLADEPKDEDAISLIRLGFLRRRVIARRDEKIAQLTPKTTRFRDKAGEFVVVLDRHGNYIGDDGSQQNAICDGYCRVVWQYLYCIDEINAAIARRAWMEPPEPMKRWPPALGRSDVVKKGSVPATPRSKDAGHAEYEDDLMRGGSSEISMSSANKDTIDRTSLSIPALYDPEMLRTAQWCAETLIGLSSVVLAVPDSATCDEDIWQREWAKPAERLINKTAQMLPQDAWRYIESTMLFMCSEESWWSRPYRRDPKQARAKKTPITLKNVANNLESEHGNMLNAHWHPMSSTPYDGPPVAEERTDYGAGYAGVEERREAPSAEVAAGHDAAVSPPSASSMVGMDDEELIQLRQQVVEDFPDSTLLCGDEPVAPGLSIFFVEYATECFLEFRCLQEWLDMSAEDWLVIEQQAIPYARTKLAQGPPGNTMESEGSP